MKIKLTTTAKSGEETQNSFVVEVTGRDNIYGYYEGSIIAKDRSTSTSEDCGNVYIFANKDNSSHNHPTKFRLYRFTMIDNGVKVRDLVPCVNKNGEVGLYDLVTRKVFTQQGELSTEFSTGDVLQISSAASEVVGVISKSYDKTVRGYINKIENNKVTLEISDNQFDINTCTVTDIGLGNDIYGFKPKQKRILCIEPVFDSKPVSLRITGITKDLRGSNTQLTVEESTLYNTLVDRLIYMLK
jgi:hypothetical protein